MILFLCQKEEEKAKYLETGEYEGEGQVPIVTSFGQKIFFNFLFCV